MNIVNNPTVRLNPPRILIIMKNINHKMKNSIAISKFVVASAAVKTAIPPEQIIITAYLLKVFTGNGVFTSNPINILVIIKR